MTSPILLFDSGVGGLSVLAAVRARLPGATFVYVADNAGFPYGTKTEAEIAGRVPALLGRLVERYRPAVAVIACNTASTIALGAVRAALALPVVGTVPAVKPAALLSKSRVIGVLGTRATVRQPYLDHLIEEFAADYVVLRHGSARLVELAEAKLRGAPADIAAFRTELDGLLGQPDGKLIDTIVLACTHFPLVAAELAAAAPRLLTFVDGAAGIGRRVATVIGERPLTGEPAAGIAVFTAPGGDIDALVPALHGYGLTALDYL